MTTESRIKTPEEILQIALRKEKASFQFYSDMLQQSERVEICRDLLDQLKNEEHKHIHMIEKELAALRRG